MNNQRRYAILLRVYTPKLGEVPERVDRALRYVSQVAQMRSKLPSIIKLVFIVPFLHDCGNTARALRESLSRVHGNELVEVVEAEGHHSSGALNRGVAEAEKLGATHVVIISGKAMSYFNSDVWTKIEEVLDSHSELGVVGVAVEELRKMVMSGRVQNTFAVWNIEMLNKAGGFNATNGVEEIAPLVQMIRMFGSCIGLINQPGEVLNIADSDTARARHNEVMNTKKSRQEEEFRLLGFGTLQDGIAFLEDGIVIRS